MYGGKLSTSDWLLLDLSEAGGKMEAMDFCWDTSLETIWGYSREGGGWLVLMTMLLDFDLFLDMSNDTR